MFSKKMHFDKRYTYPEITIELPIDDKWFSAQSVDRFVQYIPFGLLNWGEENLKEGQTAIGARRVGQRLERFYVVKYYGSKDVVAGYCDGHKHQVALSQSRIKLFDADHVVPVAVFVPYHKLNIGREWELVRYIELKHQHPSGIPYLLRDAVDNFNRFFSDLEIRVFGNMGVKGSMWWATQVYPHFPEGILSTTPTPIRDFTNLSGFGQDLIDLLNDKKSSPVPVFNQIRKFRLDFARAQNGRQLIPERHRLQEELREYIVTASNEILNTPSQYLLERSV